MHPRCRCAIIYDEVAAPRRIDNKPKPPKPESKPTSVINPLLVPALIPATTAVVTPKPVPNNKPQSEEPDTQFDFDTQRFGTYEDQVKNHGGSGNIKPDKIIEGHERTPSKTEPLTIIDHKDYKGTIDKRIFYDEKGQPYFEINTTNHGNAKNHPYGDKGEHAHDIKWSNGKAQRTTRELNSQERKDNGDIL